MVAWTWRGLVLHRGADGLIADDAVKARSSISRSTVQRAMGKPSRSI